MSDASAACPSTNLQAQSFTGDVIVRAGSNGTIPLRMHMPASTPDACQGATFPLVFTASGAPASGTDPNASGGFAFTGSENGALVLIGASACAVGWLMIRRRDRRVRT